MGRIRGSGRRNTQCNIARLRREQGSSSIFNPFSLLLIAAIACFLFLCTAYCQAQNASAADAVSNPFATPWLLSRNEASIHASTVSPAASEAAESKKQPQPAKYT